MMKLLEVSVVANRLSVSISTVYRLIRQKKLKAKSYGPKKAIRVIETDLFKFMGVTP